MPTLDENITLFFRSMTFSWRNFYKGFSWVLINDIHLQDDTIFPDMKISFGRSDECTLPLILNPRIGHGFYANTVSRTQGVLRYEKGIGLVYETQAKNDTYLLLPRYGKKLYCNNCDPRILLKINRDNSKLQMLSIIPEKIFADRELLQTIDSNFLTIYMGKRVSIPPETTFFQENKYDVSEIELWGQKAQPYYRLHININNNLYIPTN